ncbi:hypothetical protein AMTRI_Chr03g138530 [Amborella trichopoda]
MTEMGGGKREESAMNSLKFAAIIFAALGFAWLGVEMACKPFLSKGREAIDKADPAHDPDQEKEEEEKED